MTPGVGLADRSAVGRLELRGADALDLLNRLSTNQLGDLLPFRALRTVLTSSKGRIVDLLLVLRLDDRLLVLTGPGNQRRVAEHLDFYSFDEDVSVRDITLETAMLGLVGPRAGEALRAGAGAASASLEPGQGATLAAGGFDVLVVRTDFVGAPAYDVITAREGEGALRPLLARSLGEGCVAELTPRALEALRVERGVPALGSELGPAYNPLEAGLAPYVSFNKGCYVGQEVVARLNTYDKVRKHLVRLTWEAGAPVAGTPLLAGDKEVGRVTSSASSRAAGPGAGLGYVARGHDAVGQRLRAGTLDGPSVEVAGPAITP